MSENSMQQGAEQRWREPLSIEASRHATDFLMAFHGWRRKETPLAIWMALVAIVVAFVLGWAGGNARGISDGSLIESRMNAALLGVSAEGRGDGRDYLGDYFFARAADRLVTEQVSSESRGFKDRLWEQSSFFYWIGRVKPEDQRRIVTRVAEQRLKYLQPASAATLRELAAAKRDWLPAHQAQNYGNTARDYSKLLGRTISAEQLVFDAELRNNLGIVRTQQK
jgi:hypothetical protein